MFISITVADQPLRWNILKHNTKNFNNIKSSWNAIVNPQKVYTYVDHNHPYQLIKIYLLLVYVDRVCLFLTFNFFKFFINLFLKKIHYTKA